MRFTPDSKFRKRNTKYRSNQIPIIGILIFISLYIYSASLYPGGSQADTNSPGFDWFHNYWCNLLNPQAMNGMPNPARPYAIFAMLILCLSLAFFFNSFTQNYPINKNWDVTINVSGIVSMLCAVLIFSDWHDRMTSVSSAFGLVVLIGIFVGLYRHNKKKHIWTGLFSAILLAINNYIYYSGNYLYYLPFLQKITFAVVLVWIYCLNTEHNFKTHLTEINACPAPRHCKNLPAGQYCNTPNLLTHVAYSFCCHTAAARPDPPDGFCQSV
ncbi:MAG: hypothetical protein IPK76_02765 [Lewinellaceae bacterium]|nr:hypothetical protein [Lewinellaceae bacterium]